MHTLVTCLLLCCVQKAVSQSKQCGVRVGDVTFAVFNSGDDPKIAPWAVSIGYADEDEDYHHHCTGSIINGNFYGRLVNIFDICDFRKSYSHRSTLHMGSKI